MAQTSEDRNEVLRQKPLLLILFSLGSCEAKQLSSLPQVNESTRLGWPEVLIYKNKKKKGDLCLCLLLWPLAAQNKIWFLEIKWLYLLFQLLDTEMKDMKMLDRYWDPRILTEVNALPTHITKVWEARNTICHSLTHPSIHPYILSLTHLSIHFILFISILWSSLMLIFFIHSILITHSVFQELFKSEYMVGLEGAVGIFLQNYLSPDTWKIHKSIQANRCMD